MKNITTMLCLIMFLSLVIVPSTISSLEVGFYEKSCPLAETIVRNTVNKAIARNIGTAAGLIRLHFHDCFVRGCDASILLDSTPKNPSEKEHPANNPSLHGFEVIDEAKSKLEAICPLTVSCADIIAFAARDSALRVGGINYPTPAGRRDGRVSLKNDPTLNLPPPFFNATQLEENFAKKGLNLDEMVTLSGAHSIGVSHCSSFSARLYPLDLSMNPSFVDYLKQKCPQPSDDGKNSDPTVVFDAITPNRLDNKYYRGLKRNYGLLSSDQTLLSSPSTADIVRANAKHNSAWGNKFGAAMVKMGSIEVLTGYKGEIRRNCRVVN